MLSVPEQALVTIVELVLISTNNTNLVQTTRHVEKVPSTPGRGREHGNTTIRGTRRNTQGRAESSRSRGEIPVRILLCAQ